MGRRHTSLPLPVMALIAVVVVAACTSGSGALGPVPTPASSPTASAGSPMPSAVPSPAASDSFPPAPSATPASSSSPASSPSPGVSPSPAGTMTLSVYLLLAGPTGSGGLVPVAVEVPATKAVGRAAMTALLAGVGRPGTYPDSYQTLSSAIPSGTRLLGLDIADGVATVDLSGEFGSGGGSASMFARLAQVVYTLTQFPTVASVRLRIDGREVATFSSEGIVLDQPLTRTSFEDQIPAILVDQPAWGGALGNPGRIAGTANVFEAQFRIAIVAADGTVLADVPVTATCGTGCRGTFDVTIPYRLTRSGWGTLRAYDRSEKDGSIVDLREYPVYLTAS